MPKLFKLTLTAQSAKEVNVVAETQEEATAKLNLAEGETVVQADDLGDVVV